MAPSIGHGRFGNLRHEEIMTILDYATLEVNGVNFNVHVLICQAIIEDGSGREDIVLINDSLENILKD